MFRIHSSCAVALVFVVASCCSQPADTSGQPAGAAQAESSHAAAAGVTGAVSEAEFMKLHELHAGVPPELHGVAVDVSGARGYLSLPAGKTPPLGGIVVVHEWWGLNDHVKHWADRLAAEGYAALAIDLYGGVVATTPDAALAAMKGVDEAKSRATLLAAHRFLAEDPRVRATRRGCIGWCFGGSKSLALALAAPDLDACVVYYGSQLVTDPAQLAGLHAPLLCVFGSRDKSIPAEKIKAFDAALTAANKPHEILTYDAEHAFANPSNEKAYNSAHAADAWEHVRKFFAQHLATTHAQ